VRVNTNRGGTTTDPSRAPGPGPVTEGAGDREAGLDFRYRLVDGACGVDHYGGGSLTLPVLVG